MSVPNFALPNPATLADGDTIQWVAAQGRFVPVAFPSAPDLGASGVLVQANSGDNVFATDADQGDFVIPTGPDFAVINAGTGWTLTPEGCLLTYTGALTRRALITLIASVQGDVIGDSSNFGIAVDGDLVGATPAFQASSLFWSPRDGIDTLCTQRIVTLANPLTIQPVAGMATGVNVQISRLMLSVTVL